MWYRNRLSNAVPLALSLVALGGLGAQERNYTITGDGWLRLGTEEARRVQRTELTLTYKGAFAATVYVGNDRYAVRGRWTRQGPPGSDEQLLVRDAFGDPNATGHGTITFRANRSPRSLVASGR